MGIQEQDALDAMSSEFIAEIKDDLAGLETDLLSLEEKGDACDDDLINHAFRSIHSIKGGAGFLNFKELSSLSHVMESVLMQIREKKLVISSNIVDALLAGFDKMKLMVELMGKDTSCNFLSEQTTLKNILSSQPMVNETKQIDPQAADGSEPNKYEPNKHEPGPDHGQDRQKEPGQMETGNKLSRANSQRVMPVSENEWFKGKHFLIETPRLENALSSQKYLYAIYLHLKKDLIRKEKKIVSIIEDIKSIGDILYSDAESQQDPDGFYFVIATILDLPLLVQVLEIDKNQLALTNVQFTDVQSILKSLDPEPGLQPHVTTCSDKEIKKKSREPAGGIIGEQSVKADETSPLAVPESKISSSSSTQTIRINVDLISRLMNRAGEMVLSRSQLRPILETYTSGDSNVARMMQNLDIVTTDIQEAIMQMRMQPVIDLLGKYKRVVRDIARRISKKVELIIEGADVEVDRNVLEQMANPVTHLLRNCIDHGIEPPDERIRLSKPETGMIRIKAFHQGGHVHLIISDDGAGIDPQLVLSKAFEKGLVSEKQIDQLTDKQKINLIFLPGFSTSEQITDISGRGVGMDVVKTNIERLRGHIEIDSAKGQGTQVHLIIPLTLAIVPSLIVSAGPDKFAIPQMNIKEVIYLEPGEIHKQVESIGGSEVLRLREKLLPILRLRGVLGLKTYVENSGSKGKIEEKRYAIADRRQTQSTKDITEKRDINKDRRKTKWDATYIIVLKIGSNQFGLCVDELFDIEEVVVEPLSDYIKNIKCFSGATILGDGSVIMILDISGIASFSSLKFENVKTEEYNRNLLNKEDTKQKGEKRNLLVFSNADKEYFALPLGSVSRLEPINPSDIHYTGKLKYAEYDQKPVPLFSMDEFFPAGKCDFQTKEIYAIFPKHASTRVGILASKIIDTLEINEKLNKDATCHDAVLGKLFIDEMMVQVLDHEQLTQLIERQVSLTKKKA